MNEDEQMLPRSKHQSWRRTDDSPSTHYTPLSGSHSRSPTQSISSICELDAVSTFTSSSTPFSSHSDKIIPPSIDCRMRKIKTAQCSEDASRTAPINRRNNHWSTVKLWPKNCISSVRSSRPLTSSAISLMFYSLLLTLLISIFMQTAPVAGHVSREEKIRLREQVREMFYHVYDSYMKNAYPADELMPLSCKGRYCDSNPNRGDVDDALGNFSLTLVDSIDTLVIMDNLTEFETRVKDLIRDLHFDSDITVPLCAMSRQLLGGLLSAHVLSIHIRDRLDKMLWYRGELLAKATDLGHRLLVAFNSSTGLPYSQVNLKYGLQTLSSEYSDIPCTPCPAMVVLEFSALSRLSGNPIFEEKAQKALNTLWQQRTSTNGSMILHETMESFHNLLRNDTRFRAESDPFYDYLIKSYVLLLDKKLLDQFTVHYYGILKSIHHKPLTIPFRTHSPHTIAKHFSHSFLAFWPGFQALKGDITSAIEAHKILYQVMSYYEFLPQAFTYDFNLPLDQHPMLPEFVQSTYFLYSVTKDPRYLGVGKKIIESLAKHARVPCGFTTLPDIHHGDKQDRLNPFLLSQTLKYLYLLYSEESDLSLDIREYLFTSEGHLLPLSLDNYDSLKLSTPYINTTSEVIISSPTLPPTSEESEPEPEPSVAADQSPLQSFDEWKSMRIKQLTPSSEGNGNRLPSHSSTINQDITHTKPNGRNFASHECGAKVVDKNSEAEGASRILNEHMDEYMLNPCKAKIWTVIELCEPIQIQRLELANYELFSSTPKEFRVSTAPSYPTREWTLVGTFEAADSRKIQSFDVSNSQELGFNKYVHIELISRHGSEHFCPLSIVRIYGSTIVDEIEQMDQNEHHQPQPHAEEKVSEPPSVPDSVSEDDAFVETSIDISTPTKEPIHVKSFSPAHHIINFAQVTLLKLMNKFALMFMPGDGSSKKGDGKISNQTLLNSAHLYKVVRDLMPLMEPHISECSICQPRIVAMNVSTTLEGGTSSDRSVNGTCVIESSPFCRYVNVLIGDELFALLCIEHLKSCHQTAKDILICSASTSLPPQRTSRSPLAEMIHPGVSPVIPKKSTDPSSLANFNQSKEKEVPMSPRETNTNNEKTTVNKDEAKGELKEKGSSSEVEKHQNNQKIEQRPSKSLDTSPKSVEPPKDSDNSKHLSSDQAPSLQVQNDVQIKEPPPSLPSQLLSPSSPTIERPGKSFQSRDASILNHQPPSSIPASSPSPQSPPLPASQGTATKESVLIKLTKRIQALEVNLSLTSLYLEELSQRYKKQVDEMQRAFNRTIIKVNETAKATIERDLKQLNAIGVLHHQIQLLNEQVEYLYKERNHFHFQSIGLHLALMITEIVIITYVASIFTRRAIAVAATSPSKLRDVHLHDEKPANFSPEALRQNGIKLLNTPIKRPCSTPINEESLFDTPLKAKRMETEDEVKDCDKENIASTPIKREESDVSSIIETAASNSVSDDARDPIVELCEEKPSIAKAEENESSQPESNTKVSSHSLDETSKRINLVAAKLPKLKIKKKKSNEDTQGHSSPTTPLVDKGSVGNSPTNKPSQGKSNSKGKSWSLLNLYRS